MAYINGRRITQIVRTTGVAVEVEANPAGTPTEVLEKIKIADTIYAVEGGADQVDDELSLVSVLPVQNKVITKEIDKTNYSLNKLKEMFYETVVEEEKFTKDYLSLDTVPSVVNSKNVIFGGGMDSKNIKGNSFVYNQLARPLNSAYWDYTNANGTITDEVVTFTVTAKGGMLKPVDIYRPFFINGHQYLMRADVKLTTATTDVYLNSGFGNTNTAATTNWQSLYILITWDTTGGQWRYPAIVDNRESGWDAIKVKNLTLFDLTLSIITANDVATAKAELLKNGVNVDEYNPYSSGAIRDSKLLKIISCGFNQWDEEWEVGNIDGTTGQNIDNSNLIRSKNYIRIKSNTTYYFKCPVNFVGFYYDSNKNFIGGFDLRSNQTFTTASNACYLRFRSQVAYGTTYNHDICINVSNASLNGTYKPSIKHEYPLSIPVLRSAETAQDDCNDVNVGSVDLGTLTWIKESSYFKTTGLNNLIKRPENSNTVPNAKCAKLIPIHWTGGGPTVDKVLFVAPANETQAYQVWAKDTSYTDAATFKTAMNGVILNYELVTPTPQQAITLPEDIKIELGGTIEVEYDDDYSTPDDFEFEVATSKIVEE